MLAAALAGMAWTSLGPEVFIPAELSIRSLISVRSVGTNLSGSGRSL